MRRLLFLVLGLGVSSACGGVVEVPAEQEPEPEPEPEKPEPSVCRQYDNRTDCCADNSAEIGVGCGWVDPEDGILGRCIHRAAEDCISEIECHPTEHCVERVSSCGKYSMAPGTLGICVE